MKDNILMENKEIKKEISELSIKEIKKLYQAIIDGDSPLIFILDVIIFLIALL